MDQQLQGLSVRLYENYASVSVIETEIARFFNNEAMQDLVKYIRESIANAIDATANLRMLVIDREQIEADREQVFERRLNALDAMTQTFYDEIVNLQRQVGDLRESGNG